MPTARGCVSLYTSEVTVRTHIIAVANRELVIWCNNNQETQRPCVGLELQIAEREFYVTSVGNNKISGTNSSALLFPGRTL